MLLAPGTDGGDHLAAPPRVRAICFVAFADREGRVLADRWEGSVRWDQQRVQEEEATRQQGERKLTGARVDRGGGGDEEDGGAVSRAMLAGRVGAGKKAWLRVLKSTFRRVCLDGGGGDGNGDGDGDGDLTGATKDASGAATRGGAGERLHFRNTLHPNPCAAAEQIVLTLRLCRVAVRAPPTSPALHAPGGFATLSALHPGRGEEGRGHVRVERARRDEGGWRGRGGGDRVGNWGRGAGAAPQSPLGRTGIPTFPDGYSTPPSTRLSSGAAGRVTDSGAGPGGRYTPGRKKKKLATRGAVIVGGIERDAALEARGSRGDAGTPGWLRARRGDIEVGGDGDDRGGGTWEGSAANGDTGVMSTARGGGGGTLRWQQPAKAKAGWLPTVAASGSHAPHDPEIAAEEASRIARDGTDVLVVEARSAVRAAALAALACMLGFLDGGGGDQVEAGVLVKDGNDGHETVDAAYDAIILCKIL
jgi:hypothetical protein